MPAYYHNHNQEAKIQRAADYLSRLSSGELLDASTELALREEKLSGRLQTILGDKKTSEDQKRSAYYHFVLCELLMYGSEQSRERQFLLTLGFLEDGVVCSKGLCDKATIKSSLDNFGKDFVHTYYPYICYLRTIWNDDGIGEEVEDFYNPAKIAKTKGAKPDDVCHDYEESLRKTGVMLGTTYSCGG